MGLAQAAHRVAVMAEDQGTMGAVPMPVKAALAAATRATGEAVEMVTRATKADPG